jgi:hypothetical protein
VDYSGKGPLYALGSGTITNVFNSGWPGAHAFIELLLDTGPYAGRYVYYAENITPTVKVGQHVSAGQLVGRAIGTYPYIEVGWGAGTGGQTLSAKLGEIVNNPTHANTPTGKAFKNFLDALKSGVSTPNLTDASSTGGPTLPGCIPLIGWVYALLYFVCFRWLQSNKQDHRKNLLAETAITREGGGTDESDGSGRT